MRLISLLFAGSAVRATYWMEEIAHKGKASFNPDSTYTVFRSVKDYGAKGDGGMTEVSPFSCLIRQLMFL